MKTTISITPTQFELLRHDERFILILRLTRYLNLILFCFNAFTDSNKQQNLIGERQTLNSLILLSGFIYECFNEKDDYPLYKELEKRFGNYKSFNNDIKPIFQTKAYNQFCRDKLRKIRNNFAFHVDKKVYKNLLNEDIKFPENIFLHIESPEIWDSFFYLTDSISIHWIIGHHNDEEKEAKLFEDFSKTLTEITSAFIKASIKLVAEYSSEMNWQRDNLEE